MVDWALYLSEDGREEERCHLARKVSIESLVGRMIVTDELLLHPALPEPPHCWTVVPPDRSTSGHVEVLAAVGETVLTVDELDTVDQVRSPPRMCHQ